MLTGKVGEGRRLVGRGANEQHEYATEVKVRCAEVVQRWRRWLVVEAAEVKGRPKEMSDWRGEAEMTMG